MNNSAEQLKEWNFTIDEVSANVYKVIGQDKQGRIVERTGTDPEAILSKCKEDALSLSRSMLKK